MPFLTLTNIPKKYHENLGQPIKRGSNTLIFSAQTGKEDVIIFGVDPVKFWCIQKWGMAETAEKLPVSIGNRANTATFMLWRVTMPYLLTFRDVYQPFNKVHTSYVKEVLDAKVITAFSLTEYWTILSDEATFPTLSKLAKVVLEWGAHEVCPDLKHNNTLLFKGKLLPLDMAVYQPLFDSILFRGVIVK